MVTSCRESLGCEGEVKTVKWASPGKEKHWGTAHFAFITRCWEKIFHLKLLYCLKCEWDCFLWLCEMHWGGISAGMGGKKVVIVWPPAWSKVLSSNIPSLHGWPFSFILMIPLISSLIQNAAAGAWFSSSSHHPRWVQAAGDPAEMASGGTSSVPQCQLETLPVWWWRRMKKNPTGLGAAATPGKADEAVTSKLSTAFWMLFLLEQGYSWRKKNEKKN